MIPYDHTGVERAIAAQRPMALDARSRAGFHLLELAGRVHGGRIEPSPEPRAARRRTGLGLDLRRLIRRAPATTTAGTTTRGAIDGDQAAVLR